MQHQDNIEKGTPLNLATTEPNQSEAETERFIKAFWVVVIVCIMVGGAYYWFAKGKEHTLTVISTTNSLSELHMDYLLYVPGGKSTCNWAWYSDEGKQVFATASEDENGEHRFMYPKDGEGFKDPSVTCLSDNGTSYKGIFH